MTSPTKNKKIQNFSISFIIENYKIFRIFKGFEQFSSSIGWRVMDI